MKTTHAQNMVEFSRSRTELCRTTEEIDEMTPWLDHEELGDWLAVSSMDDNGEDVTVVFADGSQARWTNTERSWKVI